ncbi:mitochondrial ribosomal death-associated protein 3-domain-containing protein [Pavlovales sp. CCMP2436]|nr:mitochondrial ribosomal death-associated protein 3-domain-containing protein [Pavlovales sp. CCMP2436]
MLERLPNPSSWGSNLSAVFTGKAIGEHSAVDASRYYELPSAHIAQVFPEGFGQGVVREFTTTNLPALMVRQSGLEGREMLASLAKDPGALGKTAALLVRGNRGVGKSTTLTYLVHAARSSGWLVLFLPSAHTYINTQKRFLPLSALRIEIGLAGDGLDELFDVPLATHGLLIGFIQAHEEILATLPVKCAETGALTDALQINVKTLLDLAQLGAVKTASGEADPQLSAHALVALLRELRHVTEVPVMLAIDDVNAFDRGTIFRDPKTARPIHADQFLLPHLISSARKGGSALCNGIVLCAESTSLVYRPTETPGYRKKRIKRERLTKSWAHPGPVAEEGSTDAIVRTLVVPHYSVPELNSALRLYAHSGAFRPADRALHRAASEGQAAGQVHMLTSSRGELVRKLCSQLG